jgi:hypothetical protein
MKVFSILVVVSIVSAAVSGALIHATPDPDPLNQVTTISVAPYVLFDVYFLADYLPADGLIAAEFSVSYPSSTMLMLSSTVLNSGINVFTPPDFAIGYPFPVYEPALLCKMSFMTTSTVYDQLIQIGPASFSSVSPPAPCWVPGSDPAVINTFDYSSDLLVNPANLSAPLWTPEPTTLAFLTLGAVALLKHTKR